MFRKTYFRGNDLLRDQDALEGYETHGGFQTEKGLSYRDTVMKS